jgi:hypothetical protein
LNLRNQSYFSIILLYVFSMCEIVGVRPLILGHFIFLGYGAAPGACEKGQQWQMTLACLKDMTLAATWY